jgi:hypothetical protein
VENSRCITDEEFANQVIEVPATGDRVRLVALDHTGMLANAKERSLRRELALKTAQFGEDAPEVRVLAERLRLQQVLLTQTQAEIQRSETVAPERQSDILILHGRVVSSERLGQPGLTVSAVDPTGHPETFMCTDDRGYFKLGISAQGAAAKTVVSLQVSGKDGTILFRGTEVLTVVPGNVAYREIVLGEQIPEEPCPPPPQPQPQPETVRVPEVTGIVEAKATELLRAAKLTIGERTTKPAPDQVGLVLAQDPKAGTEVPVGSAVNLVIGADKLVTVPKVVGLKLDSARGTLAKIGLNLGKVTEQASQTVGIVLAQDPDAGKEVPPGTPVNLVVGRQG